MFFEGSMKSNDHMIISRKRKSTIPVDEHSDHLYQRIGTLEVDLAKERQKNEAQGKQIMELKEQNIDLEQNIKCQTEETVNLYFENIAFGEKISECEDKILADKTERQCQVCLDAEAKILCTPCNHIPVCQDCYNKPEVNSQCPICRSDINSIIKLKYS